MRYKSQVRYMHWQFQLELRIIKKSPFTSLNNGTKKTGLGAQVSSTYANAGGLFQRITYKFHRTINSVTTKYLDKIWPRSQIHGKIIAPVSKFSKLTANVKYVHLRCHSDTDENQFWLSNTHY